MPVISSPETLPTLLVLEPSPKAELKPLAQLPPTVLAPLPELKPTPESQTVAELAPVTESKPANTESKPVSLSIGPAPVRKRPAPKLIVVADKTIDMSRMSFTFAAKPAEPAKPVEVEITPVEPPVVPAQPKAPAAIEAPKVIEPVVISRPSKLKAPVKIGHTTVARARVKSALNTFTGNVPTYTDKLKSIKLKERSSRLGKAAVAAVVLGTVGVVPTPTKLKTTYKNRTKVAKASPVVDKSTPTPTKTRASTKERIIAGTVIPLTSAPALVGSFLAGKLVDYNKSRTETDNNKTKVIKANPGTKKPAQAKTTSRASTKERIIAGTVIPLTSAPALVGSFLAGKLVDYNKSRTETDKSRTSESRFNKKAYIAGGLGILAVGGLAYLAYRGFDFNTDAPQQAADAGNALPVKPPTASLDIPNILTDNVDKVDTSNVPTDIPVTGGEHASVVGDSIQVNQGDGIGDMIADRAGEQGVKLTGSEIYDIYQDLDVKMDGQIITGDTYRMPNGDLGISHQGPSAWQEAAQRALDDMIDIKKKKKGLG